MVLNTKLVRQFIFVLIQISLGIAFLSQKSFAETTAKTAAPAAKSAAAKPAAATLKQNTVIKFEAKEVNGAKVWLPKESTVKAGESVTLEVHNSLTAPHGFKIDGYVPETDIGAGQTKIFTITPKAKGVLKVTCHLHPAHVGAEIKVQ